MADRSADWLHQAQRDLEQAEQSMQAGRHEWPGFMPESSPPGSVLRWPSAAEVLEQAGRWAAQQQRAHADLLAVGVFGSYGRGDAGVGSDLELLSLHDCRWLVGQAPAWEEPGAPPSPTP